MPLVNRGIAMRVGRGATITRRALVCAVSISLIGLVLFTTDRAAYAARHKPPKVSKAGPPTGVDVFSFDKSVVVVWMPPSSDGGDPIRSYEARAGGTCTTGATSTQCTVYGLKNGKNYDVVKVRALTARGNGLWSAPDGVVGIPDPPNCAGGEIIAEFQNGNGCDFSGGDFSGHATGADTYFDANFSDTNLTDSSWGDVTLYGANFTDADLDGANFLVSGGSNLTNAVWSNTTCPDGTNSDNDGGTCANDLTPD
jgi:hypothetical protein